MFRWGSLLAIRRAVNASRIKPGSEEKRRDMSTASENTFLGALLGMAIGDALGAPLIGASGDDIGQRYGEVTGYLPIADP